MTLKYIWRSFQRMLSFLRPFDQPLVCFRVARSPSNSWASCYPRDAMHSAVFATATCLSGCPSVCYSRYCIKTEAATVMISSPSDSPMISLPSDRARFMRDGWVRTGDFCDFSTYKAPYLRNGARYDQGYYWALIGNRMSAFDWYQDQRPWMTLNWPWAAITRFLRYTSVLRGPPRKYEW